MLGLALAAVSTIATELGCSVGKLTIGTKEKRIYAVGTLTNIGGGLLIALMGLVLPVGFFGAGVISGFVFTVASLPYVAARVFFEILQAHLTLLAIARTERSTFGFLRTLTLPLLLAVDLLLGYSIHMLQFIGMVGIIGGLFLLFLNHGIRRRGAVVTIATAFNAVMTISLYKYDIVHFNSVAAEQSIVYVCITAYFLCMALFVAKENPFSLLRKPQYAAQLILSSASDLTISFAYLFAAASVITSAKRALGILFAIASGHYYFHERRFVLKLAAFVLVTGGVVLLAF